MLRLFLKRKFLFKTDKGGSECIKIVYINIIAFLGYFDNQLKALYKFSYMLHQAREHSDKSSTRKFIHLLFMDCFMEYLFNGN